MIYVRTGGSDANDGTSWTAAKATPQAGIDAAAPHGCAVWVGEGTYVPTWKPDPLGPANTASLKLAANVAVYGGFAGTEQALSDRDVSLHATIFTGEIGSPTTATDNLTRVVITADGSALDGATVTAGYGAGIACSIGAFTLANATVTANTGYGLQMATGCAGAFVTGSHFTSNAPLPASPALGPLSCGALWHGAGTLTVTGSDFSHNQANEFGGGAIYNSSGAANIANTTFTANTASPQQYGDGTYAGAVVVNIGPVSIDGCTFSDNASGVAVGSGGVGWGGAISAIDVLHVTHSTFTGNSTTDFGGAIYGYPRSVITIAGSTFNGTNTAGSAGGAIHAEGQLSIQTSTFTGNTASSVYGTATGGALFLARTSSAVVVSSTFDANAATRGGAIHDQSTNLEVDGCLFTDNTSLSDSGGAIARDDSGTLAVSLSTFFGNSATCSGTTTCYGGAIYNRGTSQATNSIFSKNTATTGGGQIYNDTALTGSATVAVQHSDVVGVGLTTNGDIDADPLFVSTTAGALDLHLRSGSPCVNAGSSALIPADVLDVDGNGNTTEPLPTDRGGNPRVVNTTVDMGCYESTY